MVYWNPLNQLGTEIHKFEPKRISEEPEIIQSSGIVSQAKGAIEEIDIDKLIGSKVKNDIQKDQIIDWKDIIEIG